MHMHADAGSGGCAGRAWSCLTMLPFETSQNRIVWSYPPVTSSVLARDIAPKAPCTLLNLC
jgi:hypothetical protein